MKRIILLLAISAALTSCYVTRTTIGTGPMGNDKTAKVYSKVKQGYLLGGLIPLATKQAGMPDHTHVQVKTSFKFVDMLISGITFGIYSQQTVEVLVR